VLQQYTFVFLLTIANYENKLGLANDFYQ